MFQVIARRRIWRRSTVSVSFFSASTSLENTNRPTGRKRLDVAIVGAPNAGKSQLLNVLTQSTVAAVSRKRHTTRGGIMGGRTVGNSQVVFIDTPGFLQLEHAREEGLDRDLIVTAATEMQYVDYSLLVIDAARTLTTNYREALIQLMLNSIFSQGRQEDEDFDPEGDKSKQQQRKEQKIDFSRNKFAIVLNKVDLVHPKSKLLDLAMEVGAIADECLQYQYRGQESKEDLEKELDFETLMKLAPVFYVSALDKDGTDDLMNHLVELTTPCKSWALEPGQVTSLSDEERVQELIREKIYRCLHREVPHSVQQINRMFRRVPEGLIIHQDLVVFTKSHQKLVMGSGGRTLERIQDTAVRDLKEMFGCNVVLRLHVTLKKSKSLQDMERYNHAGLTETIH
jgi:GTP-binding protein Era